MTEIGKLRSALRSAIRRRAHAEILAASLTEEIKRLKSKIAEQEAA